jgi:predicted CXXCH cytochrome family protein
MQPATEATVIGAFDGTRFEHFGTTTFFRRNGGFWVRTDDAEGKAREFQVAYTFGVVPLQQYLVPFAGGRLQALSVCWDTRPAEAGGQRWFHLHEEAIPHTDPLHWTGPFQNWNFMCADCHSTNVAKGYDVETDRYHTTWSEIDVSCEACHGPGSAHLAWAEAWNSRSDPTSELPRGALGKGLRADLRGVDHSRWVLDHDTGMAHRSGPLPEPHQVETCGRCHSRRTLIARDAPPGRALADTHRVALLDESLYHPDGQIKDEVYEYGSFVQSRMHREGVVCTDCHEPHGAGLRSPGNGLCYRCHHPDRFDVPAHHHHPRGSEGAQCVACHMPSRNYMAVDPRRDHSLRVPRPDLSATLGTPNACNECHRDETPVWAAAAVDRWYGTPKRPPHFAEALAWARRGEPHAGKALLDLVKDLEQPAIARATAVAHLGRQGYPELGEALARAAGDANPAVRVEVASQLDLLPADMRVAIGTPLLADPVRGVRIEAARAMAGVPPDFLTPGAVAARSLGLDEYIEAQRLNADRPEAHVNLGLVFSAREELGQAESAYRTALKQDPAHLQAWVNLIDLHRQKGNDPRCLEIVAEALVRLPDAAILHHVRGLSLVRAGRRDEAVGALQRAFALRPDEPRFGYVYGVALRSTVGPGGSVPVFEAVLARHPGHRETSVALCEAWVRMGEPGRAEAEARRWLEEEPENAEAQALLDRVRRGDL